MTYGKNDQAVAGVKVGKEDGAIAAFLRRTFKVAPWITVSVLIHIMAFGALLMYHVCPSGMPAGVDICASLESAGTPMPPIGEDGAIGGSDEEIEEEYEDGFLECEGDPDAPSDHPLTDDTLGALGLGAGSPTGAYAGRRGSVRRGGRSSDSSSATPAPTPASTKEPRPTARPGKESAVPARQLTAGSFDDSRDFESYLKVAEKVRYVEKAERTYGTRLLTVKVTGPDGRPLGNSRVEISTGDGHISARTRTDGRAMFLAAYDDITSDKPVKLTAYSPDGFASASKEISISDKICNEEISITGMSETDIVRELDLCFVVDCTGSMSDELRYLKAEMVNIASSVRERFPYVKQRYALVAYRDKGDDFVTRSYDFTQSLDEALANISEHRAAGGGDEPEAVHEALEDAGVLSWNSGNVARVLFHIADAAPHIEYIERTLAAMKILRAKGVAFYPVACSGVGNTAEFTMRTCALLTGSRYIFLTDHSGIGNPHAEPTVPKYKVEFLSDLMIRMIWTEIAGFEILPEEVIEEKTQPEGKAVPTTETGPVEGKKE